MISRLMLGLFALMTLGTGCATPHREPVLRYVGSSTIGQFFKDLGPHYSEVKFILDTEPESFGGVEALLEGRADVAGFAGVPDSDLLATGLEMKKIGLDAIAVVAHPQLPLQNLSRSDLARIFTGKTKNWQELGGPDLLIHPLIVGPESATRNVFRSAVLGDLDYSECQVIRPDSLLPEKVASQPGAIGHVSFSFLDMCDSVKLLSVDGQFPDPGNRAYAITRPLYLLWWSHRARVMDLVQWIETDEGQRILSKRFAGARF